MIKVNLVGAGKKRAKAGARISLSGRSVPVLLFLIFGGAVAGGYLWYSSLTSRTADLDTAIAAAQAQKLALDAVIKQNQIYEVRKKALENRIRVIEDLKRNQVNPVFALDVLGEAIERTQYVWLSQLEQANAILSMSGVGTSLNAIADFYTNLDHSGYFRNMDLQNATDSAGNFTFSLKAEFAPRPARAEAAAAAGGN